MGCNRARTKDPGEWLETPEVGSAETGRLNQYRNGTLFETQHTKRPIV